MKRLAVLISGNGSNLQSLIDHIAGGDLEAEIALVVSNRPDAFGVERAKRAGIDVAVLPLDVVTARSGDRSAYDIELADLVAAKAPDLIVHLADYAYTIDWRDQANRRDGSPRNPRG